MSEARWRRWLEGALLLLVVLATLGATPFARGAPADLVAALVVGLALALPATRDALTARAARLSFALVALVLAFGVLRSTRAPDALAAAAKLLLWLALAHVVARDADPARKLPRALVITAALYALAALPVVLGASLGLTTLGTDHYARFPLGFAVSRFVGFYPVANDVALVFVLALLVLPLTALAPRHAMLVRVLLLVGLTTTFSRLLVLGVFAALYPLRFSGRRFALYVTALAQLGAILVTHVAVSRTPTLDSLWVAHSEPFAVARGFYFWRMGYLDLKEAALRMLWERPWFGHGLRSFGDALPAHVDPAIAERIVQIGTTPHSTYGMLLAELGLVGALVAIVLAARLHRGLPPAARRAAPWVAFAITLLVAGLDYELQHHRLVYVVGGLLLANHAQDART